MASACLQHMGFTAAAATELTSIAGQDLSTLEEYAELDSGGQKSLWQLLACLVGLNAEGERDPGIKTSGKAQARDAEKARRSAQGGGGKGGGGGGGNKGTKPKGGKAPWKDKRGFNKAVKNEVKRQVSALGIKKPPGNANDGSDDKEPMKDAHDIRQSAKKKKKSGN
jgi:hypothetical protein